MYEAYSEAYLRTHLAKIVREGRVIKTLCPDDLGHLASDHVCVSDADMIEKLYRETGRASAFSSSEEAERLLSVVFTDFFSSFYRHYSFAVSKGWKVFRFTVRIHGSKMRGIRLKQKEHKIYEAFTPYVSLIVRPTENRRFAETGFYIETAFPEMTPPEDVYKKEDPILYTRAVLLPAIEETGWFKEQENFVKLYIRLAQANHSGWHVTSNLDRYWMGNVLTVETESGVIRVRKEPDHLAVFLYSLDRRPLHTPLPELKKDNLGLYEAYRVVVSTIKY